MQFAVRQCEETGWRIKGQVFIVLFISVFTERINALSSPFFCHLAVLLKKLLSKKVHLWWCGEMIDQQLAREHCLLT